MTTETKFGLILVHFWEVSSKRCHDLEIHERCEIGRATNADEKNAILFVVVVIIITSN